MARLSREAERKAWTEFVDGPPDVAPSTNKYGNKRSGKYASQHEEDIAARLAALERCGNIVNLKEQVRIILVPGNPPLKPIIYIADFTYNDLDGTPHCVDAKGFKTQIFRLKKRMAALLLNLEIEEV